VQYRNEFILNIIVFVVGVCGVQYREELILNVTLLLLSVWGGNVERN